MSTNPIPVISVVVLVGPVIHDTLDRCMSSLARSSGVSFEILLVANASKAGAHAKLQGTYKNARVIFMGRNSGIAGYNAGIRKARAPYVLLLDEDCQVRNDALSKFVHALTSSPPKTAAVAGNVYNVGQKRVFYQKVPKIDGSLTTFPGGATAFKKDMFNKTGMFDEDFFLWIHEDDLAIRILENGYSIQFDETITVEHHDEEAAMRPLQATLIFRNKAWLNVKYFSFLLLAVLVLRDVFWIMSYALYKRSIMAFGYAAAGYMWGYATSVRMLAKRRMIRWGLQASLIKFYFTYRNG